MEIQGREGREPPSPPLLWFSRAPAPPLEQLVAERPTAVVGKLIVGAASSDRGFPFRRGHSNQTRKRRGGGLVRTYLTSDSPPTPFTPTGHPTRLRAGYGPQDSISRGIFHRSYNREAGFFLRSFTPWRRGGGGGWADLAGPSPRGVPPDPLEPAEGQEIYNFFLFFG